PPGIPVLHAPSTTPASTTRGSRRRGTVGKSHHGDHVGSKGPTLARVDRPRRCSGPTLAGDAVPVEPARSGGERRRSGRGAGRVGRTPGGAAKAVAPHRPGPGAPGARGSPSYRARARPTSPP